MIFTQNIFEIGIMPVILTLPTENVLANLLYTRCFIIMNDKMSISNQDLWKILSGHSSLRDPVSICTNDPLNSIKVPRVYDSIHTSAFT